MHLQVHYTSWPVHFVVAAVLLSFENVNQDGELSMFLFGLLMCHFYRPMIFFFFHFGRCINMIGQISLRLI